MLDFYKGKRVFITGHTGFKGAWLTKILVMAGAEVYGYSLAPEGEENLYDISGVDGSVVSVIGDIRDFDKLKEAFDKAQPEIVMHLAAQPIVRESYKDPRYTYETNVMGTVNICECVRLSNTVRSFLNVTTDKVYQNNEWEWGYREDEKLDGYDPYSNSKSCSELVTHSYINSFFNEMNIAVSTARAGNVIGGGDFAVDRIVPDCVRAVQSGKKLVLRNPYSTRPFQHVLEALSAYLLLCQKQYEDRKYAGFYNVGPNESDAVTAKKLAILFKDKWKDGFDYEIRSDGGPHEANYLKLDCSKIKSKLGWSPKWDIEKAIEATTEWTRAYFAGDAVSCMEKQIEDYFK
jgi:CDP-glucose 4,6-dehydratase